MNSFSTSAFMDPFSTSAFSRIHVICAVMPLTVYPRAKLPAATFLMKQRSIHFFKNSSAWLACRQYYDWCVIMRIQMTGSYRGAFCWLPQSGSAVVVLGGSWVMRWSVSWRVIHLLLCFRRRPVLIHNSLCWEFLVPWSVTVISFFL